MWCSLQRSHLSLLMLLHFLPSACQYCPPCPAPLCVHPAATCCCTPHPCYLLLHTPPLPVCHPLLHLQPQELHSPREHDAVLRLRGGGREAKMMQPSNHWRIQMESLHSTADEDSNYVCMGCYQEVSENESIVCMICGRAWHACCALHHQPFASSTLGSLNQEWVCPLHGAMHQPQGDEFPLTLRSITSLEQLTKGDALLILQGPGEWAYGWVQRLNGSPSLQP